MQPYAHDDDTNTQTTHQSTRSPASIGSKDDEEDIHQPPAVTTGQEEDFASPSLSDPDRASRSAPVCPISSSPSIFIPPAHTQLHSKQTSHDAHRNAHEEEYHDIARSQVEVAAAAHRPADRSDVQQHQCKCKYCGVVIEPIEEGDTSTESRRAPWWSIPAFDKVLSPLFPDHRSRLVAIVIFIGTLFVTAFWLYQVIQNRWIESHRSPQQIVSYERVEFLPAFFGAAMAVLQTDKLGQIQGMIDQRMTIQSNVIANKSMHWQVGRNIGCQTLEQINYRMCQPLDPLGMPLLKDATYTSPELGGVDALYTATTAWPQPLQLRHTNEAFCVSMHILWNDTIVKTVRTDRETWANLVLVRASDLQSIRSAFASNDTQTIFQLISFMPPGHTLPIHSFTELAFTATQKINLDGDAFLTYQYSSLGSSQRWIDATLSKQFALFNASMTEEDRTQWLSQMSDPNVSYTLTSACLRPASFDVQIIREVANYGLSDFVSDIGGFWNTLGVIIAFLFPLAFSVTLPRTFIIFKLGGNKPKSKSKKEKKMEEEDGKGTASGSGRNYGIEKSVESEPQCHVHAEPEAIELQSA